MVNESSLLFQLNDASAKVNLLLYDQLGKTIRSRTYEGVKGENRITLYKEGLKTGVYFCKLSSTKGEFLGFIKLLVN